MATTVALFRERFPEFADNTEYPDERVQLFLGDAASPAHMGVTESHWCDTYDYAQAYLAAHLLTSAESTEVGDASIQSGPIASKTVDGVSITRVVSTTDRSGSDEFYMGTSYGQRFIHARNMCMIPMAVACAL